MARKAKVTVIVDDNGSMRLTEASAKKLGTQLDKVGNSARNTDRGMRGTAEMSSNSTKNFAKQSQMMGGVLVPAYATLAAQIFALSAAYRFFQSAADLRVLQDGQASYAATTGSSLASITASLQAATQGQLAYREAAQAAAIGTAAGLTASQLQRLSTVATKASSALGRDLTDSFNRLIRGAIKAEPELLDELGIIIRLAEAAENYGAKIGKAGKDLTTFEKSQAVVNAVIEQGEDKFGKFEVKVNAVNQAGKSFNDLLINLQLSLAPFVELLSTAVSQSGLFAAAIAGFAFAGPLRSIAPTAPVMAGFDSKEQLGRNVIDQGYMGSRMEQMATGTFDDADLEQIIKDPGQGDVGDAPLAKQKAKMVKHYAVQTRAAVLQEQALVQGGMNGFFMKQKAQYISMMGTSTNVFKSIRTVGVLSFTAIGAAAATAFSVLAIAGVLYTLFELAKAWYDSTDSLHEYKKATDASNKAMKEQVENAAKVADGFNAIETDASTAAIGLSKFLNSLSFSIPDNYLERLNPNSFMFKEAARDYIEQVQAFKDELFDIANNWLTDIPLIGQLGGFLYAASVKTKQEVELDRLRDRTSVTKDELLLMRRAVDLVQTAMNGLKGNDSFKKSAGGAKFLNEILEDIRPEYEELLRISQEQVLTETDRTRVLEIMRGLDQRGIASLGKQVQKWTELEGKATASSNAATEYAKELAKAGNLLGTEDLFKTTRIQIESILGEVDALAEKLDVVGQDSTPVSEDLASSLTALFGKEMPDGIKTTEATLESANKALNNFLTTLLLVKSAQEGAILGNYTRKVQSLQVSSNPSRLNKAAERDRGTEDAIAEVQSKIDSDQVLIDGLKSRGSIDPESPSFNDNNVNLQNLIKLQALQKQHVIALRAANVEMGKRQVFMDALGDDKHDAKIRDLEGSLAALKVDKTRLDSGVQLAAIKLDTLKNEETTNEKLIERYNNLTRPLIAGEQQQLDLAIANLNVAEAKNAQGERELTLARGLLAVKKQQNTVDNLRTTELLRQANETPLYSSQAEGERNAANEAILLRQDADALRAEAAGNGLGAKLGGGEWLPGEEAGLEEKAQMKERNAEQVVELASAAEKAGQAIYEGLSSALKDGLTSIFEGGSIKKAALNFFLEIGKTFQNIMMDSLIEGILEGSKAAELAKKIGSSIGGLFGMKRYGGYANEARYGYAGMGDGYAQGGIARGRDSGYPTMLHGTEAIVPLPDGNNIPVKMEGNAGNTNNVSVAVNIDSNGNAQSQTDGAGSDMKNRIFAESISRAVQDELKIQSREGGILARK